METCYQLTLAVFSDGGGEVTAARKPVQGLAKVSKFLIGISKKNAENISVEMTMVNNRPGFKALIDGRLHSVWTFDIQNHHITKIFAVLNPKKLIWI